MSWNQYQSTVKSFHYEDEPEIIHIVKTGFKDLYIVVYEDAFEQFIFGKNDYLTKQQVEEKFKISLDEHCQNFSSQIAEQIMKNFPIEHTDEMIKKVHNHILTILQSTGLDESSRKDYVAVNSYKQKIRNKYQNVIDVVEEKFPNGLYTKDKDGELVGANVIFKSIIAEYLEFKTNGCEEE